MLTLLSVFLMLERRASPPQSLSTWPSGIEMSALFPKGPVLPSKGGPMVRGDLLKIIIRTPLGVIVKATDSWGRLEHSRYFCTYYFKTPWRSNQHETPQVLRIQMLYSLKLCNPTNLLAFQDVPKTVYGRSPEKTLSELGMCEIWRKT